MAISITHPLLLFIVDALVVVLLGFAWAEIIRRRNAYDTWTKGTATVTIIRRAGRALARIVYFTFEFPYRGQVVKGLDMKLLGFRNCSVKVGDQIDILVNPTMPRRSIIFGTRRSVYIYAATGMVPLSLMVAYAIFVQLRYVSEF